MPSASVRHPPPDRELAADRNRFARELFTGLPRHYDTLEAVLSLGQNRRWRRAMIDRVVADAPARMLDVATGTAGVAIEVVRRTPGFVVGVDLTDTMLRRGQQRIARHGGEPRIGLVCARAEQLPFADGTFDALTFTYLLRYVDPAATLTELARVLKPGAPVASLEFHVPPRRFWWAWWWLYTRAVLPVAGALAGRSWFRVGRFLGPNISAHYRRYPLSSIVAAWTQSGLVDVDFRLMSLGGGVVMWGRKGE